MMDEWLRLLLEEGAPGSEWAPDFEADQWLVQAKIGPWRRFYLRPPGFRPRFWHRLHPLPVRLWRLDYGKELFDGLCRLQVKLRIRYQVTPAYVRRHPEVLADSDSHVRTAFEPLVLDLLDHRTHLLQSGDWIETGLTEVRQGIEEEVNLLLARHHLRCRTLCDLEPEFSEPGDTHRLLFQEKVYRAIEARRRAWQQSYFQERKRRLQERQHHEAELTRIRQEADRQREIDEGAHRKKMQEIRARQQAEARNREIRLREETLKHRERLAAMELERRGEPEEKVGRQQPDRTSQVEEGDDRAYQSLLRKLEFGVTPDLQGKTFLFADLEPQLKALIDNPSGGTGSAGTDLALSSGWLRRLLRRLWFFLRGLQ